jgi:DNA-binding response OmpR family regulator
MSSAPQILCYGRDFPLLETRKLVLQWVGFRVELAKDRAEFEAIADRERIDLAILCHSLSYGECRETVSLIQDRWPKLKVLILCAGISPYDGDMTAEVLNATEGPRVLLNTVQKMVKRGPYPVFF